jgi:hypothetical protein
MDIYDEIKLDPTAGSNPLHLVDEGGRYLDPTVELMYKLIEAQFKAAVGKGHDREVSYEERRDAIIDALGVLNSAWFDQLCDDIGLELDNVMPKIREMAIQRLTKSKRFIAYQVKVEEYA